LEYEKEITIQLLFTGIIHRTNSSMRFFGIQMENAFADKITMKCTFLLQLLKRFWLSSKLAH